MLIQFSVRIAGHSRYGNTTSDVLEGLAEVDAGDGDVGAALPGSVLGAELGDLGVGAGLLPVQPRDVVPGPALVLHLASLCSLKMVKKSTSDSVDIHSNNQISMKRIFSLKVWFAFKFCHLVRRR